MALLQYSLLGLAALCVLVFFILAVIVRIWNHRVESMPSGDARIAARETYRKGSAKIMKAHPGALLIVAGSAAAVWIIIRVIISFL